MTSTCENESATFKSATYPVLLSYYIYMFCHLTNTSTQHAKYDKAPTNHFTVNVPCPPRHRRNQNQVSIF